MGTRESSSWMTMLQSHPRQVGQGLLVQNLLDAVRDVVVQDNPGLLNAS